MTLLESRIFQTLLLSMGCDSARMMQLCMPMRKKRYQRVTRIYRVLTLTLCIAALWGLYAALGRFESWHNQGQAAMYMLLASVNICGLLYLCKGACEAALLDEKKCFEELFKQFQACGSVQSLFDQLYKRDTSIQDSLEEDDISGLKLFSNVFARAACVIAALLLAIGLFSAFMQNRTMYGINRTGVTLVSWRGKTDESGVVKIPGEVWGRPVTRVGKRAFGGQKDIRKVIVPASVKEIDSGAFIQCGSLEEVVLPDTLTVLGAEVFQDCTALKSFTAPASLTEIRAYAFKNCLSLESVVLHDGIAAIHAHAFSLCEKLTSIVMPASMPGGKIGEEAFFFCKNLKSIVLPEGIVKISARAFYYCNSLEKIIIPLSVDYLGNKAFDACQSLKTVYIPKGCELAGNAFGSCRAQKHYYSSPDQIPQEYREAF